jgi:Electron transfer flavoprotein, beta subunit
MVNTLVSVKSCVDVDSVKVDRATGLVSVEGVPRKFNDFDKNALEEALRIKEKFGGKVVVVTVGQTGAREVLKEALSMGADEAYYVADPSLQEFDSRAVAIVLSRVFSKLGPFDLVLMGEGSVDHYSLQVGPRLAELLNLPQLTYVRKLELNAQELTVERDLEYGIQIVKSSLPAVVTVAQEINQPRLPTLKSILAASKKEIKQLTLSELNLKADELKRVVTTKEIRAPKSDRKRIVIDGSKPAEAVQTLLKYLKQEGVI